MNGPSSIEEAVGGMTLVWWMCTAGICPMITRERYPELSELIQDLLWRARFLT